jgi:hypothetical protein
MCAGDEATSGDGPGESQTWSAIRPVRRARGSVWRLPARRISFSSRAPHCPRNTRTHVPGRSIERPGTVAVFRGLGSGLDRSTACPSTSAASVRRPGPRPSRARSSRRSSRRRTSSSRSASESAPASVPSCLEPAPAWRTGGVRRQTGSPTLSHLRRVVLNTTITAAATAITPTTSTANTTNPSQLTAIAMLLGLPATWDGPTIPAAPLPPAFAGRPPTRPRPARAWRCPGTPARRCRRVPTACPPRTPPGTWPR